ncbi:MAG: hypothetical protein AABY15_07315 [Nanoarchaeota archaeon]
MSKELSFDFCIIPNPFSNGKRNMIFIAKSGDNFLDKSIIDSKDYLDIKEILEKFGYTETSYLQFESSNNSGAPESSLREVKKFLENCGLSYSRELEVNVIRDLTNLKNETDKAAMNNVDFIYGGNNFGMENIPIEENTKNKLIESRSELFRFKYKEPEVSEKVTLYFYLFLEFGFNHFGKPIVQFGGDFSSSDDHDDRNYIKVVESDFIRISDPKKPNSIVLSSCKNQGDLLKEIGILYSGYFKYQKSIETNESMIVQEKKYPYRLAEIKNFLDPNQSIVVITNRMGYDRLITLSNKLKVEKTIESKQFIPLGEIEQEAERLFQFLNKKMKTLSDHEEFEEAAKMKKDVDFIEGQLEYVKNLNKREITTEEYFKIFSIP